jgi:hypothetical protein
MNEISDILIKKLKLHSKCKTRENETKESDEDSDRKEL